jgi:NADH-quinone oxidoreductase subunit A
MLGDWAAVLVYLMFAALIPAGLLFGSIVAGVKPRRAGKSKSMPFESGVSRGRFSPANFSINYYLVAMLFIVFDIEIVFLYPLAVNLELLGRFGFWELSVFVGILALGYVYVWKKGALEWR